MKRRILSFVLLLALTAAVPSVNADGDTPAPGGDSQIYAVYIEKGDVTVSNAGSAVTLQYYDTDGALKTVSPFNPADVISVYGAGFGKGGILVSGGFGPDTPVNIVLNGVTMNQTGTGSYRNAPIQLQSGANVTLTLAGDNVLVSRNNWPAIHVPPGTKLTIDGDGSLDASVGSFSAAAIGAGDSSSSTSVACGTIHILSGTITAKGGTAGAGIGGRGTGDGGVITIDGGYVTASGGTNAPGIGGSYGTGSAGSITVNGGTVVATGYNYGAGIGGGYNNGDTTTRGNSGVITITGGFVTATGGANGGAGVGGGLNGNGERIEIRGGTVNAEGGLGGSGIGGGRNNLTTLNSGNGGVIVISGGAVNATGGGSAQNNGGGAGIGGGYRGNGGTTTISGGVVTAKSVFAGAGIGGGGAYVRGGEGGTITITGGIVTATGSSTSSLRAGAGIGGGDTGNGGTIRISGGTVTASSVYAPDIGAGRTGETTLTATVIIDGGSVNAAKTTGQPKNSGGASVYRSVITIPGAAAAKVDGLSVQSGGAPLDYGTNDMYTDDAGSLYLWTPAAQTGISVTVGGADRSFEGTVNPNNNNSLSPRYIDIELLTASRILATLPANIRVKVTSVGFAAGEPIRVELRGPDGTVYGAAYADSDGVALIRASAFPEAGVYRFAAAYGDASGGLEFPVDPYDAGIWDAFASRAPDGRTVITFGEEPVSRFGSFDGCVSVNGSAVGSGASVAGNSIVIPYEYDKLKPGSKIVVTGVTYPKLFPSYSFTFTVTVK